MQPPPISQAEIAARIGGHLDELLALWQAEQGAGKPRDLALIAAVLSLPHERPLRVLDLCCGPGDVGRAIRRAYPNAEIDGVDRDPFLISICSGVNRRDRVPGRIVVADLAADGWQRELPSGYDAVVVVNALHWFDVARAGQLARDVHALLRGGGVFVLAEPAATAAPFETGFDAWKAAQPPRYTHENWLRFWARANALLGYDHPALWGPRDESRIDERLSVAHWTGLLQSAGFAAIDVLWRDADQVIMAAVKP